ncbi:MAG: hypothetical protein J6W35_03455 [Eubacterium sp.]|nr:hypothetical protein [Eubacterium sp.]
MRKSVEYQIFIGLNDSQVYEEVVNEKELVEMVSSFFERKEVDFSMFRAKVGYCYDSDKFVVESVLCINIIGKSMLDISRMAKSLSMYMNQESILIVRNELKQKFN